MQLSLEGDNFFMQNSFLGLPSPPPDAIISPLGSKLEIQKNIEISSTYQVKAENPRD